MILDRTQKMTLGLYRLGWSKARLFDVQVKFFTVFHHIKHSVQI